MKVREEIINQIWVNKSDIQTALGVSRWIAADLFKRAEDVDSEKFKEFRPERTKVRMSTVLRCYGTSYEELKKRLNP